MTSPSNKLPTAIVAEIHSIGVWTPEEVLERMGGPWKPLILYYVLEEVHGFYEIRNLMRECEKITLSLTLNELVEAGLLKREHRPGIPPRVRFYLSELGERFKPIFEALYLWTLQQRSS